MMRWVSAFCLLMAVVLLCVAVIGGVRSFIGLKPRLQLVSTDGMDSLLLEMDEEMTRHLTIANHTDTTVRLINDMGWD